MRSYAMREEAVIGGMLPQKGEASLQAGDHVHRRPEHAAYSASSVGSEQAHAASTLHSCPEGQHQNPLAKRRRKQLRLIEGSAMKHRLAIMISLAGVTIMASSTILASAGRSAAARRWWRPRRWRRHVARRRWRGGFPAAVARPLLWCASQPSKQRTQHARRFSRQHQPEIAGGTGCLRRQPGGYAIASTSRSPATGATSTAATSTPATSTRQHQPRKHQLNRNINIDNDWTALGRRLYRPGYGYGAAAEPSRGWRGDRRSFTVRFLPIASRFTVCRSHIITAEASGISRPMLGRRFNMLW